MNVVWTAVRRSSMTTMMVEDSIRCSSTVQRFMSSSNNRNKYSNNVSKNNRNSTNNNNRMKDTFTKKSSPLNLKLRSHAVSIFHGNYEDYYNNDDDGEEEAFPNQEDITMGGSMNQQEEEEESEWMMDKSMEDQKKEDRLAERVYQMQLAKEAQQQKWMDNAKMPVRTVQIDARGRAYGRGGRKTSSARVWIQPGDGIVTINRRTLLDFFPRESHRELLLSPLIATQTVGKFDIMAHVEGGGLSGKAGAIRHGLARALQHYNPIDHRPPLKKLGYLTRDPRKVERKKIGLKKARKAPQWVRR